MCGYDHLFEAFQTILLIYCFLSFVFIPYVTTNCFKLTFFLADDYMSPPFNSSNSSRHNRLPSSRRQISRTVPWSKEICSTLNVDDDDDVIEIPKKLSDSLDRKRKCSGRMLTSTPNMPGKFTSDQNCAEDDVIFVKSSKSLGEKQKNFNR